MAGKRRSQWTAGEPLRALKPAAFGELGARAVKVVKLYYGLGDGDPLTSGEIGVRLGLRADRVRQIVCRSVERLLGPAAQHVLGKASRSTTSTSMAR
jgi:DNA-directed RNA polymerase sigma subunit (sigma70/sigma32)